MLSGVLMYLKMCPFCTMITPPSIDHSINLHTARKLHFMQWSSTQILFHFLWKVSLIILAQFDIQELSLPPTSLMHDWMAPLCKYDHTPQYPALTTPFIEHKILRLQLYQQADTYHPLCNCYTAQFVNLQSEINLNQILRCSLPCYPHLQHGMRVP